MARQGRGLQEETSTTRYDLGGASGISAIGPPYSQAFGVMSQLSAATGIRCICPAQCRQTSGISAHPFTELWHPGAAPYAPATSVQHLPFKGIRHHNQQPRFTGRRPSGRQPQSPVVRRFNTAPVVTGISSWLRVDRRSISRTATARAAALDYRPAPFHRPKFTDRQRFERRARFFSRRCCSRCARAARRWVSRKV